LLKYRQNKTVICIDISDKAIYKSEEKRKK